MTATRARSRYAARMRKLRPAIAALAVLLAGPAGAIDVDGLAPEVDACSDFYGFVNGRWMASTELAADRSRIGSFDSLRVANNRLLERALTELSAQPESLPTAGQRLVAADFAAGMDAVAIEARGLASLAPLLERIATLKSADELPALLGALARVQVAAPLAAFVAPDARDKRRYVLTLRQAGLGLPDRDDYFNDDEHARRVRLAYRGYARRLLGLAGALSDDATVDALMAFEKRLAKASLTRAEQRDPVAVYNPFTTARLAAAAPGLDWAAFLAAYSGRAADEQRFVLGEPGFAKALGLAASEPLAVWRSYLRMRLLDATAPRLPKAFEQASFDYHQRALRGLQQAQPRAERVLLDIGVSPIAEGLGEVYVARAFSPRAQARALELVADVKTAMRAHIEKLAWMSAPTQQRALAKLDAIVPKIGAPAEWRRYEGLVLARDDFAGNQLRAAEWLSAQRLAELEGPVDRRRWNTSPHIVNAFAGSLNDIVFPAGILQPPFFDENADDAVNYGAIGAVIGHEITHHFDDRGRQFDADGNLSDWWTADDAAAYRARAERVAALYSGYEPTPGVRIAGRQTLGENISDLSGVQIAFDSLQLALRRSGKAEAVDGLTPDQRFFVAYATVWRSKMRVEALVNQLRTDSHSPTPYRVLGPLSNTPAFAAAFGCKAGSTMVAADPIAIW